MVKEHRRRDRSSSGDSDGSRHRKKHRKHRREHSDSPKESYKSAPHRSRRHSESPIHIKRHIKQEPISDDSDDDRQRHRVKTEKTDHHRVNREQRGGRHQRDRHAESHRPVRVKEEPTDEDNWQRQQADRRRHDETRRVDRDRRDRLPDNQNYGQQDTANGSDEPPQPKDAPNFELSGKLTEDTNTYKGVVIKYNEPPEARKPKKRWRLYPFKNDEALKPFHMHRQSAYLFGRDRLIADIPIDHPSCSKQHAVFQYRMVPFEKEDGRKAHKIAPYIIDLGSANGTFVNNKQIEPQRYVELREKDVLKFGFSSREYVLLHDRSDTTELEED